MTYEIIKQLVTSLLLSRIDCCNSLLLGLSASNLAPLQRVQNVATLPFLKLDHRTPVKPALQRLHWLPAKAWIEFKIATLMHAIHHQRGPAYLSNMVQFNTAESGRRRLRSATTNAAFVVRTWTQFGKRAFSDCGPSIWNQIPPHIRNLHSAPAFRKALNTHLFLQLSTL